MKLHVFKSLWEWNGEWLGRLEQIAEAGYSGVEYLPPPLPSEDSSFRSALNSLQLRFIAQIYTDGPDHIASFRERALRAASFNPLLINSHSAQDRMHPDEQLRFFEAALRVEQEVGIPIAHETHRGRAFFTPWQTAFILERLPELRIGADFSHWAVACEALPSRNDRDVMTAMQRAIHIHGRVGYSQGAQVPDPRAPEYAEHVEAFMQFWLTISKHRLDEGIPFMTFTPEFGPPPYLQTMPYTGEPAADLWEVNLWMFKRFKQRFEELFNEKNT